MEPVLDTVEIRVLGCLIEKELATPEYYPLTLNALTNACNQRSNRDPVMTLEEPEVVKALDSLRFRQLAITSGEGSRVPKYRHILAERLKLTPAELAILAELLLRGPQTPGELRGRTERMHPYHDQSALEKALQELMERDPPLVVRLPRRTGHKEQRIAHLFAGVPEPPAEGMAAPVSERGGARLEKLEEEVGLLREEVAELKRIVEDFRAQFE